MSSDGHWKLHLPHEYRTLVKAGNDGSPGKYTKKKIDLSLFDMKNDPYEKVNVIEAYPEIAATLKHCAEQHKKKFYE